MVIAVVSQWFANNRHPCFRVSLFTHHPTRLSPSHSHTAAPNTALLPFHGVDNLLDAASINEGKQRYEKMISGLYLGELCRLLFLHLAAAGAVFAAPTESGAPRGAGRLLTVPDSFTTAMMSEVAEDLTPELTGVGRLLADKLALPGSTLGDRQVIKEVVGLVARRAARLAAVGVAAVLQQMGSPEGRGINTAVDGSVFKKFPAFPDMMMEGLADLGAPHAGLVHAEDGSGLGAAIVALIAEGMRKNKANL